MSITQVESQQQITDVQALLHEYLAWSATLSEDNISAPTFEGYEQELAELPGIYVPPAGRLLIAYYDQQPAGCVALKPIDEAASSDAKTAELKRLYVKPELRGLKIGYALVSHLMQEARQAGYQRMILDSHITMQTAHDIYEAHGFRRVDAPADFPEWLKPVVVFMECEL